MLNNQAKKQNTLRFLQGLLGILFLIFLVVTVFLSHDSVITPGVRIATALTVVCGLASFALYLVRVLLIFPVLRFPAALVGAFAVLWIFIYERQIDSQRIRDLYLKQLSTYSGSPYVRGGETLNGVDESGLARAAFWKTILQYGFQELNLQILGPEFWRFWWIDLSSNDLLTGRFGFTHRLQAEDKKLPGDIAIANNRVLIFLGSDQWIEANANAKRVVIQKNFPNDSAVFVRWWIL